MRRFEKSGDTASPLSPHSKLRKLLNPAHVGAEGFGDGDGAVGVLIVFDEGDDETRQGDAGTIQCMQELRLAVFVATADAGAAGLIVPEVTD